MNIWTKVEWHDLRIAPDDIPEPGEELLVTVERFDGSRKVEANVYLKELTNGRTCWCYKAFDKVTECFEKTSVMIWYEVVAWAYYPGAYMR